MNVQIEESWKAHLQPEFEKDYFGSAGHPWGLGQPASKGASPTRGLD